MSTYNVTFSGLDALLQSLPENTVDTPYDICITEIREGQCQGDYQASEGTLQYTLQQNISKYIKLSFGVIVNFLSKQCKEAFRNCTNLIFADCSNFRNIEYTDGMFYGCTNLKGVDCSSFNTVTNTSNMFDRCTSLIAIDCSVFSNVTIAWDMFDRCASLTSVDCSAFTSLAGASNMFYQCTNLTSIALPSVNNLNASNMFNGCSNLTYVYNLFDFNTVKKASYYYNMFRMVPLSVKLHNSTEALAVSNAKWLYDKSIWGSSSYQGVVKCYYGNIENMKKSSTITPSIFSDNVLTVEEGKEDAIVAYNMLNNDAFGLISATKNSPVKVKYEVEGNEFSPMWNTMSFGYYVNDSSTSPTNSEYTQDHIPYCDYSETTLPSTVTSLNITGDVSVVKSPILTSSGISNYNSAFLNCTSLTELPELPSTVTSTQNTFRGCTSLTEIDVSFGGNITNATRMFYGCTALETADISSMTSLDDATAMFKDCTSLTEVIR